MAYFFHWYADRPVRLQGSKLMKGWKRRTGRELPQIFTVPDLKGSAHSTLPAQHRIWAKPCTSQLLSHKKPNRQNCARSYTHPSIAQSQNKCLNEQIKINKGSDVSGCKKTKQKKPACVTLSDDGNYSVVLPLTFVPSTPFYHLWAGWWKA